MNLLKVENEKSLETLKNHMDGEIVYVQDKQKFYIYEDNRWRLFEFNNDGETELGLSLYDMNKQIVSQLSTLTGLDLEEGKLTFSHYVNSQEHKDNYYMLLCHDLRYFTVFARDSKYEEDIIDAIMDCLKYVGDIKSIELSEDGQAVEIWIVTNNEAYVMYFFEYGKGVIQCQ